MMSHDMVESVNRIPKVGYNNHSDRGGGCPEHPTLRKSRVVAQVWEWWFLQFDLPLHTRRVPHRTLCVVSTMMETVVQSLTPIPIPRLPRPGTLFKHGQKSCRGEIAKSNAELLK